MATIIKEDPKDPDIELYKIRNQLNLESMGNFMKKKYLYHFEISLLTFF